MIFMGTVNYCFCCVNDDLVNNHPDPPIKCYDAFSIPQQQMSDRCFINVMGHHLTLSQEAKIQ